MAIGLRWALASWIVASPAHWALAQTSGPADPPPEQSALTAQMFYNILLGELHLQQIQQGGEQGQSLRNALVPIFDAANQSKDERLFERAMQIAIGGRDGQAALQVVRAWKLAHPQSSIANRHHMQVLLALNRVQDTLPLLSQELRRSDVTERKRLIEHLPSIYAQVPDKARLADWITPVLREHLAHAQTAAVSHVALAKLRARAGQTDQALDGIRAALAQESDNASALSLAVELMGPERTLAEALVSEHLQRKPADHPLRFALARKLIQLDRTEEARTQLQRVIAGQPDWGMPHLILGTLAAEQNNTPLAETSIQNYLRLQSNAKAEDTLPRGEMQAYLVLSSLALRKQDYDRALYWLDQIKVVTDSLSLMIQRANIVSKQGRLTEALELLEGETVEGTEDTRRKVIAMASLLREHKQYQQAYELLGLWKTRLRNDPELLLQQSFMAEKLQRFDLMESLLREHMRLQPNEHAAYNALGYSLADRNERLPEAKALIEKALSIVPGDPYVTDSLAWVEFRMGQHQRARELLEQAMQRKPDAEIAAHLAEVYWMLGQSDKARDMLRRAHALAPDHETLIGTAKRLGLPLPTDRKP